MHDPLVLANEAIRHASPALFRALSPLGRAVVYPPDIPFQAAQAKGKRYNATIGQITDGRGRILSLAAVEHVLGALSEPDRNSALLYSPVDGMSELRDRWREWQRPGWDEEPDSTLPLVTAGLTHGLSLAADLFAGPGRAVVVPAPAWGNYHQIFADRTGARFLTPAAYRDGRFNPEAAAEALEELPPDEPALVILNLPSNPGGFTPNVEERRRLVDALAAAADRRPLVAVCDDAYAGLVYDEDLPRESLYWHLAGRHPNLVPIKVDGSSKEFVLFGARVGFLSFPFAPDSDIAQALTSKVKCLVRATVGSPVALSQTVLLQALREKEIAHQIEGVRQILSRRYEALKAALRSGNPELLRPLPFNSGVFALLELPAGLDPEAVRCHLLEAEDTGVVSVAPRYLRLAFCSVDERDLAELVERVERGIGELMSRRGAS